MVIAWLGKDLVEVRNGANEQAVAKFVREQTGRSTGRVTYITAGLYQVELS